MASLRSVTTRAIACLAGMAAPSLATGQPSESRVVDKWTATYSMGTSFGTAGSGLENAFWLARFNQSWSSFDPGGCRQPGWGLGGPVCSGPRATSSKSLKARDRGPSRSVSLGYALRPTVAIRAHGGVEQTGSVSGLRNDGLGLRTDHDVMTVGAQGVVRAGPLRLGIGPEYSRIAVKSMVTNTNNAPVSSRQERFHRVGALASTSLVFGGAVFLEVGVQYHLVPHVSISPLNVRSDDPQYSTTVARTNASFNRGTLVLSGGIRQRPN